MEKPQKTSLKLPIFLIVGPAAAIVLAVVLFAITNLIFAGSNMAPVDGGISGSITQDAALFEEPSMGETLINIFLFLLGAISVIAFLPCLIIGCVLLGKRQAARRAKLHNFGEQQRTWKDVA